MVLEVMKSWRLILSESQADAVHQVQATIASLEVTIESLRAIGPLRGVACIEAELQKERRNV